jgi:hypothetical protein
MAARNMAAESPAANAARNMAAEGPAANAAEGIARPVLLIDTQDVSRFCAERLHKQNIN